MQQYKAVDGQSLLDICLQTYGSLEFIYKLIQDNGIASINSDVSSSQIFIWDDSLVLNQELNSSYIQSRIIYATKL